MKRGICRSLRVYTPFRIQGFVDLLPEGFLKARPTFWPFYEEHIFRAYVRRNELNFRNLSTENMTPFVCGVRM